MAGSVNKVILVGNLGRDPEIRSTQDGTRVANLSLATSESWRDKNSGERREKTEWHRVVVFNERIVDVAEKYLHKGSKVYVGASCRRANGPTNRARRNTPPRSCCSVSAANSPCSTPAAPAVKPAATPSRPMKARRKAAPPAAAVAAAAGRQVRAPTSTTTSRSSPSSQETNPNIFTLEEPSMSKEAVAALRQGKLSRRDFNRALAAVGLSFAVMPLTARSSRAASNLTFFTWAGYDVPEAAPQYGAKHGGPPSYAFSRARKRRCRRCSRDSSRI